MKLKALRPFYKDGGVILDGETFETEEQHGRELITRSIAAPAEEDDKQEQKRRTKKEG
ncbi:hypothetical protein [Pseudomonas brenneri]|uniref:hypothetical protein n=1 Tax=Pseudomonas brenneri TaxID=129817 RepID=UPI0028D321B1|nr:hypothetical protein [Pseudomonas brenneri]